MDELVTVGVYGYDAEHFFRALLDARVDTFCDIRRRRAVRGHEYAFANSARLQARLAELGIRYLHLLDLAPSDALRKSQQAVDHDQHTPRRQRTELSPAFVHGYAETVLAGFDSQDFVARVGPNAHTVALLCVEREPAACHRSLLAQRLHDDLGVPVRHLVPKPGLVPT